MCFRRFPLDSFESAPVHRPHTRPLLCPHSTHCRHAQVCPSPPFIAQTSFLKPGSVLYNDVDGFTPEALGDGFTTFLIDYIFLGGIVLTFWLLIIYLKVVNAHGASDRV